MVNSTNLESVVRSSGFVGLALWKTPSGYACSVEFEDGHWTPHVERESASGALFATLAVPVAPPPY